MLNILYNSKSILLQYSYNSKSTKHIKSKLVKLKLHTK